jgi:hypothetical protein
MHRDTTRRVTEYKLLQITVAERSKARVCGRRLAGIAGSNSAWGVDVCVLSARGLCVGLVTRPGES